MEYMEYVEQLTSINNDLNSAYLLDSHDKIIDENDHEEFPELDKGNKSQLIGRN